jgi:voltage-gated potassium channel
VSDLKRKMIISATAVLGIIIIGTFGLAFLEDWSIFNSFWMTVVSITTTGYGDMIPVTKAGKIFTMVLLICGIGLVLYAMSIFVSSIVENQISKFKKRDRMMDAIKHLENHVIVCGAGRVGINAAHVLSNYKEPFVLIDIKEDLVEIAAEEGYLVMLGDATSDEVLINAGIRRAKGIVCALSEDAHNVFCVLTARALNPGLKIVARAVEPETVPKLHRAGADKVISPTQSGGYQMAMAVIKPAAVEMVNTLFTSKYLEVQIEEVEIDEHSMIANQPINMAFNRENNNVIVVAIIRDEKFILNPRSKDMIVPGDTLLLIGSRQDLNGLDCKFK